jgi:DNA-binding LacI/PurR family transcriptional regulator
LKKRKLIGVIISEVEGIYQNKLLKGIISECYALDYDVAVFSTLIKDSGLPEYKVGEKNIFNLINFELFDGIIVAGLTLAIKDLPQEIEQMLLKKCRCPVLFVDMSSIYFPSVYTNDRKSMELMTDHLIEVHGYRNIICLTGEKSNISTISRVAGFKDSFRKHGIPLEKKQIL